VLLLLCQAHLAGGDAGAASRALDALEAEAPEAAATEPSIQALFVQAKVAAGKAPEALRFLVERLSCQAELASVPAGREAAAAFVAGLRLALHHISEDSLPSFQSAVSSFMWKATAAGAAAPAALLNLVQALLAQEQVGNSTTSEVAVVGWVMQGSLLRTVCTVHCSCWYSRSCSAASAALPASSVPLSPLPLPAGQQPVPAAGAAGSSR